MINSIERQPMEWEKMSENHVSDNVYIQNIQRIYTTTITTKNNLIQNGQKIWIDIYLKKIYKWPIKGKKSCSVSLIIREIQI